LTELSEKVLKLTTQLIGPASRKFLERQTISHMNGLNFDALEPKHLPDLARWVEISAGLIIKPEVAKGLALKIAALK
jgi:hypothetical protein